MSLLILKAGVLATVQDLGRNGFRRFGINPNGAMDTHAARLINILLGNEETAGVLEMHFPAPVLQFEAETVIALGGADFGAKINGEKIENWCPIVVEKNSILSFSERESGARCYLAVKNRFAAENWLNSQSTNLKAKIGGFDGRALNKGDRLTFTKLPTNNKQRTNYKLSPALIPVYSNFPTVRVTAGAEWEKLTTESQSAFLSGSFTVRHESDRMGFRLRGAELQLRETVELVSSAVNFGSIQLLPDGQLIVLMADHQTTGGYGRIAHVAAIDLPLLAQLNANDQVYFQVIPLAEAENLNLQFERDLSYLKTICRFL